MCGIVNNPSTFHWNWLEKSEKKIIKAALHEHFIEIINSLCAEIPSIENIGKMVDCIVKYSIKNKGLTPTEKKSVFTFLTIFQNNYRAGSSSYISAFYFSAICNENEELSEEILESFRTKAYMRWKQIEHSNSPVNNFYKDERSPQEKQMMLFCSLGDRKNLLPLLEKVDVNVPDTKTGITALMAACESENQEICTILLDHLANIDAVTTGGSTAIMLAAAKGNFSLVQMLLERKAAIEKATTEEGLTPFLIAWTMGHYNIASLLINHGADIDAHDVKGIRAFLIAIKNGDVEKTEFLINNGAKIDHLPADAESPIHLACRYGYQAIVNLLAIKGADLNACDTDGMTPLKTAWEHNHFDIAHTLIAHGAAISGHSSEKPNIIYWAINAEDHDKVEFLMGSLARLKGTP